MDKSERQIDYKTHILIGVRADHVMNVIGDWRHVPSQTDVQKTIDGTPGPCVTFALCTPTSIMAANRQIEAVKQIPSRFGTPTAVRRRWP